MKRYFKLAIGGLLTLCFLIGITNFTSCSSGSDDSDPSMKITLTNATTGVEIKSSSKEKVTVDKKSKTLPVYNVDASQVSSVKFTAKASDCTPKGWQLVGMRNVGREENYVATKPFSIDDEKNTMAIRPQSADFKLSSLDANATTIAALGITNKKVFEYVKNPNDFYNGHFVIRIKAIKGKGLKTDKTYTEKDFIFVITNSSKKEGEPDITPDDDKPVNPNDNPDSDVVVVPEGDGAKGAYTVNNINTEEWGVGDLKEDNAKYVYAYVYPLKDASGNEAFGWAKKTTAEMKDKKGVVTFDAPAAGFTHVILVMATAEDLKEGVIGADDSNANWKKVSKQTYSLKVVKGNATITYGATHPLTIHVRNNNKETAPTIWAWSYALNPTNQKNAVPGGAISELIGDKDGNGAMEEDKSATDDPNSNGFKWYKKEFKKGDANVYLGDKLYFKVNNAEPVYEPVYYGGDIWLDLSGQTTAIPIDKQPMTPAPKTDGAMKITGVPYDGTVLNEGTKYDGVYLRLKNATQTYWIATETVKEETVEEGKPKTATITFNKPEKFAYTSLKIVQNVYGKTAEDYTLNTAEDLVTKDDGNVVDGSKSEANWGNKARESYEIIAEPSEAAIAYGRGFDLTLYIKDDKGDATAATAWAWVKSVKNANVGSYANISELAGGDAKKGAMDMAKDEKNPGWFKITFAKGYIGDGVIAFNYKMGDAAEVKDIEVPSSFTGKSVVIWFSPAEQGNDRFTTDLPKERAAGAYKVTGIPVAALGKGLTKNNNNVYISFTNAKTSIKDKEKTAIAWAKNSTFTVSADEKTYDVTFDYPVGVGDDNKDGDNPAVLKSFDYLIVVNADLNSITPGLYVKSEADNGYYGYAAGKSDGSDGAWDKVHNQTYDIKNPFTDKVKTVAYGKTYPLVVLVKTASTTAPKLWAWSKAGAKVEEGGLNLDIGKISELCGGSFANGDTMVAATAKDVTDYKLGEATGWFKYEYKKDAKDVYLGDILYLKVGDRNVAPTSIFPKTSKDADGKDVVTAYPGYLYVDATAASFEASFVKPIPRASGAYKITGIPYNVLGLEKGGDIYESDLYVVLYPVNNTKNDKETGGKEWVNIAKLDKKTEGADTEHSTLDISFNLSPDKDDQGCSKDFKYAIVVKKNSGSEITEGYMQDDKGNWANRAAQTYNIPTAYTFTGATPVTTTAYGRTLPLTLYVKALQTPYIWAWSEAGRTEIDTGAVTSGHNLDIGKLSEKAGKTPGTRYAMTAIGADDTNIGNTDRNLWYKVDFKSGANNLYLGDGLYFEYSLGAADATGYKVGSFDITDKLDNNDRSGKTYKSFNGKIFYDTDSMIVSFVEPAPQEKGSKSITAIPKTAFSEKVLTTDLFVILHPVTKGSGSSKKSGAIVTKVMSRSPSKELTRGDDKVASYDVTFNVDETLTNNDYVYATVFEQKALDGQTEGFFENGAWDKVVSQTYNIPFTKATTTKEYGEKKDITIYIKENEAPTLWVYTDAANNGKILDKIYDPDGKDWKMGELSRGMGEDYDAQTPLTALDGQATWWKKEVKGYMGDTLFFQVNSGTAIESPMHDTFYFNKDATHTETADNRFSATLPKEKTAGKFKITGIPIAPAKKVLSANANANTLYAYIYDAVKDGKKGVEWVEVNTVTPSGEGDSKVVEVTFDSTCNTFGYVVIAERGADAIGEKNLGFFPLTSTGAEPKQNAENWAKIAYHNEWQKRLQTADIFFEGVKDTAKSVAYGQAFPLTIYVRAASNPALWIRSGSQEYSKMIGAEGDTNLTPNMTYDKPGWYKKEFKKDSANIYLKDTIYVQINGETLWTNNEEAKGAKAIPPKDMKVESGAYSLYIDPTAAVTKDADNRFVKDYVAEPAEDAANTVSNLSIAELGPWANSTNTYIYAWKSDATSANVKHSWIKATKVTLVPDTANPPDHAKDTLKVSYDNSKLTTGFDHIKVMVVKNGGKITQSTAATTPLSATVNSANWANVMVIDKKVCKSQDIVASSSSTAIDYANMFKPLTIYVRAWFQPHLWAFNDAVALSEVLTGQTDANNDAALMEACTGADAGWYKTTFKVGEKNIWNGENFKFKVGAVIGGPTSSGSMYEGIEYGKTEVSVSRDKVSADGNVYYDISATAADDVIKSTKPTSAIVDPTAASVTAKAVFNITGVPMSVLGPEPMPGKLWVYTWNKPATGAETSKQWTKVGFVKDADKDTCTLVAFASSTYNDNTSSAVALAGDFNRFIVATAKKDAAMTSPAFGADDANIIKKSTDRTAAAASVTAKEIPYTAAGARLTIHVKQVTRPRVWAWLSDKTKGSEDEKLSEAIETFATAGNAFIRESGKSNWWSMEFEKDGESVFKGGKVKFQFDNLDAVDANRITYETSTSLDAKATDIYVDASLNSDFSKCVKVIQEGATGDAANPPATYTTNPTPGAYTITNIENKESSNTSVGFLQDFDINAVEGNIYVRLTGAKKYGVANAGIKGYDWVKASTVEILDSGKVKVTFDKSIKDTDTDATEIFDTAIIVVKDRSKSISTGFATSEGSNWNAKTLQTKDLKIYTQTNADGTVTSLPVLVTDCDAPPAAAVHPLTMYVLSADGKAPALWAHTNSVKLSEVIGKTWNACAMTACAAADCTETTHGTCAWYVDGKAKWYKMEFKKADGSNVWTGEQIKMQLNQAQNATDVPVVNSLIWYNPTANAGAQWGTGLPPHDAAAPATPPAGKFSFDNLVKRFYAGRK